MGAPSQKERQCSTVDLSSDRCVEHNPSTDGGEAAQLKRKTKEDICDGFKGVIIWVWSSDIVSFQKLVSPVTKQACGAKSSALQPVAAADVDPLLSE